MKTGIQKFANVKKEPLNRKQTKKGHFEFVENQVRVLEKFALIYGVGCLAANFKLVPWLEAGLQSAIQEFEVPPSDHIRSDKDQTSSAVILREFVNANRRAFKKLMSGLTTTNKKYLDAKGFLEESDGCQMVYLRLDVFGSLFPNKAECKRAKCDLHSQGIIKCDAPSASPRFVVEKIICRTAGRKPVRRYLVKVDMGALNLNSEKKPVKTGG